MLRGNHEWLRWFDNRITSGVYPAEALASIEPHGVCAEAEFPAQRGDA